MTLICARTASIRRTVLLAFPLALILAACSGAPYATEGYGPSSPPLVSSPPSVPAYSPYDRVTPPRRALNPYAPYEQFTDSALRSGGP
jgi:hypothetical protein